MKRRGVLVFGVLVFVTTTHKHRAINSIAQFRYVSAWETDFEFYSPKRGSGEYGAGFNENKQSKDQIEPCSFINRERFQCNFLSSVLLYLRLAFGFKLETSLSRRFLRA